MEIQAAIAKKEKKPAAFLNMVHIALDTYDDIFSDFDPSSYSVRILSDDFLKEVQKRYMENKKGIFEVRFTLPKFNRSLKTEALIKKRLKDYFTQQLKYIDDELTKRRKRGGVYIAVGFILLASQIILADYEGYTNLLKLIEILLVPAGWYGMFVGIENLVEVPGRLEEQKRFYEKFQKAAYYFFSEEDVIQQIEATATKPEEKPLSKEAPSSEQPKQAEKKETKIV